MATFVGKFPAKVDDKGRLVLPSPLKYSVPGGSDLRFVIKKSNDKKCLEMWPYDVWVKDADKIREKLNFFNPQHVQFWRQYMRDCDMVEPDPKVGRISISRYLLDAIGVNKDVVFSGVHFMIEIWAKENFDNSELSQDAFDAIAQTFSGK